jgi:hypothetical protein
LGRILEISGNAIINTRPRVNGIKNIEIPFIITLMESFSPMSPLVEKGLVTVRGCD